MSQDSKPLDASFEARIDALELKLMDVENTVHELNDVILRQYRDIERLRLQHDELMNRLHGAAEPVGTPAAGDEVPPHY